MRRLGLPLLMGVMTPDDSNHLLDATQAALVTTRMTKVTQWNQNQMLRDYADCDANETPWVKEKQKKKNVSVGRILKMNRMMSLKPQLG